MENIRYDKQIDELKKYGTISDELNKVLTNLKKVDDLTYNDLYNIIYINYTIEQYLKTPIDNDIVKSKLQEENLRLQSIISLINDKTYNEIKNRVKQEENEKFKGIQVQELKSKSITKMYFQKNIFKFVIISLLVLIMCISPFSKMSTAIQNSIEKNNDKKIIELETQAVEVEEVDENEEMMDSINSLFSILLTMFRFIGIILMMLAMTKFINAFRCEDPEMKASATMSLLVSMVLIILPSLMSGLIGESTSTTTAMTNEELKEICELIQNIMFGIGAIFNLTIITTLIQAMSNIIWLNKNKDIYKKEAPWYVSIKTFDILSQYQKEKFKTIYKNANESNKFEILDCIIKNTQKLSKLNVKYVNNNFIKEIKTLKKDCEYAKDISQLLSYAKIEYLFTNLSAEEQYAILHPDFINNMDKAS